MYGAPVHLYKPYVSVSLVLLYKFYEGLLKGLKPEIAWQDFSPHIWYNRAVKGLVLIQCAMHSRVQITIASLL